MAEPMTFDPIKAVASSWKLIFVLAVIGAAVLVALSSVRPVQYTSHSTLLFTPSNPTDPTGGTVTSATDIATALNTQSEIVLSDDVLQPVAARLGTTSLNLRKRLTVTTSTDSNILTVDGRAGTGAGAQDLTRSVVASYQQADKAQAGKQLQTQIAAVQASINATSSMLSRINGLGAGAEANRGALTAQLTTLAAQEQQLKTATALYAGQVSTLTTADLPIGPSSSGPVKSGVEGAVLGGVVGILLGLYRQWSKANRAVPERPPVRQAIRQQPAGYEAPALRRR